jgi:membrane protein implicated in regulation of membrane protease activity
MSDGSVLLILLLMITILFVLWLIALALAASWPYSGYALLLIGAWAAAATYYSRKR